MFTFLSLDCQLITMRSFSHSAGSKIFLGFFSLSFTFDGYFTQHSLRTNTSYVPSFSIINLFLIFCVFLCSWTWTRDQCRLYGPSTLSIINLFLICCVFLCNWTWTRDQCRLYDPSTLSITILFFIFCVFLCNWTWTRDPCRLYDPSTLSITIIFLIFCVFLCNWTWTRDPCRLYDPSTLSITILFLIFLNHFDYTTVIRMQVFPTSWDRRGYWMRLAWRKERATDANLLLVFTSCLRIFLSLEFLVVVFHFKPPHMKRLRIRYVVVAVDLFLFISCMQRCVLMGTHPLADYDKRIADS